MEVTVTQATVTLLFLKVASWIALLIISLQVMQQRFFMWNGVLSEKPSCAVVQMMGKETRDILRML